MTEADISIKNHEATFELDVLGEIGGSYKGTFQFRLNLTPMQEIQADKDYRQLLGDNPNDAPTKIKNLAYIITQLKQRVIQAPPFWYHESTQFHGSHIKDSIVLETVFQAAILAQEKYMTILTEKQLEATKRLKTVLEKRSEENKINDELR